jgi:hypothetical protein
VDDVLLLQTGDKLLLQDGDDLLLQNQAGGGGGGGAAAKLPLAGKGAMIGGGLVNGGPISA